MKPSTSELEALIAVVKAQRGPTRGMPDEVSDRLEDSLQHHLRAPLQRSRAKVDILSMLWVLPVAALILASLIAGAYAALPHRSSPRAHNGVPK